jgi:ribosome maturation factor RimP
LDAAAEAVREVVEPMIDSYGMELVQIHYVHGAHRATVRLFVDKKAGAVGIDDLEKLSRLIGDALDVEDAHKKLFKAQWDLEVSSPGIDRPLRTAAHFQHFAGSEAKIQLAVPLHTESGDRKNFKGVIKGVVDDKVEIVCDGHPFQLPIADIDHAKLVPDWEAVMHGKSGVGTANLPKPIKPGHRPSQKPKHKH